MKCLAAALLFAAVLAAAFLAPRPAAAQRPGPAQQPSRSTNADTAGGTADLLITLHDANKAAFLQPAKVTLHSSAGDLRGTSIAEKGRAIFRGLTLDTYAVSVEVQGSPTTQASVSLQLAGENQTLDIIVGVGNSSGSGGPPMPPPLSLKEQKELTAGLAALQSQNLKEAKKYLLSAAKTAPNHPDIDYLLGILATISGDFVTAKQYFQNAATRYQHVRSLIALGELNLVEGNLLEAKSHLEIAIGADPTSWRAEQLLAAVYARQQSHSDAINHAERALQLGKADANGARLTLAEALSAIGDYRRSVQALNDLLKQNPTESQKKQANQLLETNRAALASSSAPGKSMPTLPILPLSASLPSLSSNPRSDYRHWVPPNVDDVIPPTDPTVSCPLPEILERTGQRVLEFVDNLDRFTATERLGHQSLNEFGLAVRDEQKTFDYLVLIRQVKPGIFDVSEYRNGSDSQEIFPEHVATLGTVALVFVFHPNYVHDFDFQCEGLTHQGNESVWQIRFQQKPELPSRLRSYRLGTKYYRVGIKGRTWISKNSFQVLRMESDLVNQVPDLRLNAEHQDITYGPVPFQKRNLVLWLPYSADTYLDFNGHRFHRRQELSNYLLFWVDDRERDEKPKEVTEQEQPAPNS